MRTEKHPFSRVVHYGTGGWVINAHGKYPAKASFSTLCGRKFKQGHSKLMQSGAVGAKNTTCKQCKEKLNKN